MASKAHPVGSNATMSAAPVVASTFLLRAFIGRAFRLSACWTGVQLLGAGPVELNTTQIRMSQNTRANLPRRPECEVALRETDTVDPPGLLFLGSAAAYGIGRLGLEMLRADALGTPLPTRMNLTFSAMLAVVSLAAVVSKLR
jgi:hypothetical protein